MKAIVTLLLSSFLLQSCVSSRIGSGGWPERTKDPTLELEDKHHYLSPSDLRTIHEVIWAENANLRVFSIRVVKPGTVLVICTDVPGESFSRSIGFDMIKTEEGWKFGKFKGKLSPI